MQNRVKTRLSSFILGISLLTIPFSASWAILILDFSLNDSGGSQTVTGQIFLPESEGTNIQATDVTITTSPFVGSVGSYFDMMPSYNSFSLTGGTITFIDFQSDLVSGTGSSFRLSFLGDINNSSFGNNTTLTTLGGGPSISGKTFPDTFSPTVNEVPSPAPITLLGAGLIALTFSRRKFLRASGKLAS